MGRKGMLSQIHTTGQKERTAYLFKSISIYYENTAVLHSSHRLKSLIYFWCKKHNTCRNSRFIEAVFHSCICVQLPRTTKHILRKKKKRKRGAQHNIKNSITLMNLVLQLNVFIRNPLNHLAMTTKDLFPVYCRCIITWVFILLRLLRHVCSTDGVHAYVF